MTDRFPSPGLREALTAAGWSPGRQAGPQARRELLVAAALTASSGPARELFPAAERLLGEFSGLALRAAGPGEEVAAHSCLIDPGEARFAGDAVTALAGRLGTPAFPIGRSGGSALAVDIHGRLFRQGQGDWWFLGATPLEGLARLVEGYAPARVSADGRWAALAPLPREVGRHDWTETGADGADPLAGALRTAMVAAFLLHRHGLLATRLLRLTVAGAEPSRPLLDRVFPLGTGSLDQHAAQITEALKLPAGPEPLVRVRARLTGTAPAAPDGPADEPSSGWDCLATVSPAGRHEVVLRHRTPAEAQVPATAAQAVTAGLAAYAASRSTTAGPA
ncbi:SUKH-3 domain-containing protein [Kitasatospora sp. HPMI-4]|uniref:SUKH-3 domain-containing protein n=1 Tax=Kitasatospora sp. HPMI-4 TaxID=3448443 RepID=UPI003F19A67B